MQYSSYFTFHKARLVHNATGTVDPTLDLAHDTLYSLFTLLHCYNYIVCKLSIKISLRLNTEYYYRPT